MINFLNLLLFSFFCSVPLQAQITISGPMQGHTTDSTSNIWLMTKKKQSKLSFEIQDQPGVVVQSKSTCHKRWCTYNLNIEGLSSEENHLIIKSDTKEQIWTFKASDESNKKSFSFLLGSCTLRWGVFQILAPGNGYRIFKRMSEHDTELMLWMGDNVYYLLGDHKNEANMFRENAKSRKKKAMDVFIRNNQHYAIWDDHDFGPDNSLGNYEKKDISKKVFDDFWPNPSDNSNGTYYSFQYANAEFFMLDSRWFRTEPETKPNALLGEAQLNWLTQELISSNAKFKFVVLGSQIINPKGTHHERFASFQNEYNTLLKTASELENVIFLSGDMHYSTAFINKDFGKTLYEFSCSPLTSYRYKIKKDSDEYQNPYFVEGTQYHKQNFGKVTLNDDQCTFEVFDKKDKLVWSYTFP